jgi:penicillin G amidase
MKVVKFFVSLLFTLALIYFLDNSWNISGLPLPPLGKFLDPYHGFWQNLESSDERTQHDITLEGLKAPVTVVFDSLMIPHIFAENDEDLYTAQGYVTAMHRLFQMEFLTKVAAGRASEMFSGEAVLNFDRGQRRQGMVYGAKNAVRFMERDPLVSKVISGYTTGVNQYIASLDYKDLPLEYKLLDLEPEQWSPLSCALLLKYMAQTLNIGDKDFEMTNALKLFGKEYTDLLYPDDEGMGDPIVDNPEGWNFKPVTFDTVPLAVPGEYVPKEVIKVKRRPASDPTTGSNNWAVSGTKTATGSPMLANDPHLQLTLPSIWFVVQLHAPGVNVMGASLPGAPCVVIGFNDSIAWGVTNAQRDLVDWYKITYENEKKEKYLLDSQWVNTEKVIEEFKIKGGSTFYDTITYTQWGPVTYDKGYHAEDNRSDYAFRWIAHDESEEIMALYKLNRAKNHQGYLDAISHFHSPAQNFVFASVSGDIAIKVQGKFPVRRPFEGKFVLDGSKSSSGWQAFIPDDQNVAQKNPTRGFVSSANQYPADKTYPYYITSTHYEAYRNRRINQVLAEKDSITVEDMMKLQTDNYNLKAAESLPYFLSQLDTTKLADSEKNAYDILKKWDYFNEATAIGASYYESWWDALMPMLWDEMAGDELLLERPTTYQTIKLLKEQPTLSFFDIRETDSVETAADVIRQAFTVGVENVEKKRVEMEKAYFKEFPLHTTYASAVNWASFKGSVIQHILPPLKPLSIEVSTGGNHDIVNAHSKTHGPSWRMVVSLEKTGVKAWGTYPGGQSGNPGSKFYSNMINTWSGGKYYQLWFMQKVNEQADLIHTITLKPQ